MGKKTTQKPIYYNLPFVVSMIRDLKSGTKGLYALLNFNASGRHYCRMTVSLMAYCLGTSRETIRRSLAELKRVGLIKITKENGGPKYYIIPQYRKGPSIPLLAVVMKRKKISFSYKLLICLLSFRQGSNEWMWEKQKELAADLGLTVCTIQRDLTAMKANAEIQIRLRRQNRRSGNKYALTCGARIGGRIFSPFSHITESTTLKKKMKAKSYLTTLRKKSLLESLSKIGSPDEIEAEAVYSELAGCGINEKVARPMAVNDKQPFESVVNAIMNAKILRAAVWKRALEAGLPRPKFNVAGYVVSALNAARREGKVIGTTKLFRQARAEFQALKLREAGRGQWEPKSGAEFEASRRKLIRELVNTCAGCDGVI